MMVLICHFYLCIGACANFSRDRSLRNEILSHWLVLLLRVSCTRRMHIASVHLDWVILARSQRVAACVGSRRLLMELNG